MLVTTLIWLQMTFTIWTKNTEKFLKLSSMFRSLLIFCSLNAYEQDILCKIKSNIYF